MEKISYLIYIVSVFLASVAQILLKKSADTEAHRISLLKRFFNIKVMIAYIILFTTLFINTLILKYIDLKYIPFITSTSFLWVLVLSYIFFKDKPSKKKVIGVFFIIIGVIISRIK